MILQDWLDSKKDSFIDPNCYEIDELSKQVTMTKKQIYKWIINHRSKPSKKSLTIDKKVSLMSHYSFCNKNPTFSECKALSEQLELNVIQIKNWFDRQNKKSK